MSAWIFMNIKGHGHSLTKVTQIQHLRTSFAHKPLGRLKPNFIWCLHGILGLIFFFSNVPGHMTMPIHGEIEYYQCFHITLGWSWPFMFPNASAWVKAYTALSANVFFKFVLIHHILSTQVSDTGPMVLWFYHFKCNIGNMTVTRKCPHCRRANMGHVPYTL